MRLHAPSKFADFSAKTHRNYARPFLPGPRRKVRVRRSSSGVANDQRSLVFEVGRMIFPGILWLGKMVCTEWIYRRQRNQGIEFYTTRRIRFIKKAREEQTYIHDVYFEPLKKRIWPDFNQNAKNHYDRLDYLEGHALHPPRGMKSGILVISDEQEVSQILIPYFIGKEYLADGAVPKFLRPVLRWLRIGSQCVFFGTPFHQPANQIYTRSGTLDEMENPLLRERLNSAIRKLQIRHLAPVVVFFQFANTPETDGLRQILNLKKYWTWFENHLHFKELWARVQGKTPETISIENQQRRRVRLQNKYLQKLEVWARHFSRLNTLGRQNLVSFERIPPYISFRNTLENEWISHVSSSKEKDFRFSMHVFLFLQAMIYSEEKNPTEIRKDENPLTFRDLYLRNLGYPDGITNLPERLQKLLGDPEDLVTLRDLYLKKLGYPDGITNLPERLRNLLGNHGERKNLGYDISWDEILTVESASLSCLVDTNGNYLYELPTIVRNFLWRNYPKSSQPVSLLGKTLLLLSQILDLKSDLFREGFSDNEIAQLKVESPIQHFPRYEQYIASLHGIARTTYRRRERIFARTQGDYPMRTLTGQAVLPYMDEIYAAFVRQRREAKLIRGYFISRRKMEYLAKNKLVRFTLIWHRDPETQETHFAGFRMDRVGGDAFYNRFLCIAERYAYSPAKPSKAHPPEDHPKHFIWDRLMHELSRSAIHERKGRGIFGSLTTYRAKAQLGYQPVELVTLRRFLPIIGWPLEFFAWWASRKIPEQVQLN